MCEDGKKCQIVCENDTSGHRKRLRERFARVGLDGFSHHEIVELLLTLCIPRKDVKPLAKKMLAHFGSIRRIMHAEPSELALFSSSEMLPFVIGFFTELNEFIMKNDIKCDTDTVLDTCEKLQTFWIARIGSLAYEVFELALLDANFKLLHDGIVRLHKGSMHTIQIDVHTLFHFSINKHASAIVIAHNHPSGVCKPSVDDIVLTEKIFHGSSYLNIIFIDHLIVTHDCGFSFRRSGELARFCK